MPFTERCAEAVEAILRAGMDTSDLPCQARRRPHAVVHAGLGTVLGLPGHGRPFLERFGLIPAGTAAALSCDALVEVVLTNGDKVLNAGNAIRTVSTAQHTATRDNGRLVFRDPHGRLITNTHDVLTDQLALLRCPQPPGTGPEDHDPTAEAVTKAVTKAVVDGRWPDSRYLHGPWGWNGPDPTPPPGHAPPQAE